MQKKQLTIPLNNQGLYKACDIIRMQEFPFSKTKFYELVKNGNIPAVKIGSSTLYKGETINEWFEQAA